jgi:hypothetical protein
MGGSEHTIASRWEADRSHLSKDHSACALHQVTATRRDGSLVGSVLQLAGSDLYGREGAILFRPRHEPDGYRYQMEDGDPRRGAYRQDGPLKSLAPASPCVRGSDA